jgi:hypothetical protein
MYYNSVHKNIILYNLPQTTLNDEKEEGEEEWKYYSRINPDTDMNLDGIVLQKGKSKRVIWVYRAPPTTVYENVKKNNNLLIPVVISEMAKKSILVNDPLVDVIITGNFGLEPDRENHNFGFVKLTANNFSTTNSQKSHDHIFSSINTFEKLHMIIFPLSKFNNDFELSDHDPISLQIIDKIVKKVK